MIDLIFFYGVTFASVFGVIGFLVYLEIKHGGKQLTPEKRAELVKANSKHCWEQNWPKFHSEWCFNCGYDLIEHYGEDYATATPTSCPRCHRSYLD